jgi:hypothetical protein
MVELIRDIRRTIGWYGYVDSKTFVIDCGSVEFEALMSSCGYVFNLY